MSDYWCHKWQKFKVGAEIVLDFSIFVIVGIKYFWLCIVVAAVVIFGVSKCTEFIEEDMARREALVKDCEATVRSLHGYPIEWKCPNGRVYKKCGH